jgi:hypothetical protein
MVAQLAVEERRAEACCRSRADPRWAAASSRRDRNAAALEEIDRVVLDERVDPGREAGAARGLEVLEVAEDLEKQVLHAVVELSR